MSKNIFSCFFKQNKKKPRPVSNELIKTWPVSPIKPPKENGNNKVQSIEYKHMPSLTGN